MNLQYNKYSQISVFLCCSLCLLLLLASAFNFHAAVILTLITLIAAVAVWLHLRSGIIVHSNTDNSHRINDSEQILFATLSPNPVLSVDRNGTIQFANPAAEKFFGGRNSELIGSAIRESIPETRELDLSRIIESSNTLTITSGSDEWVYQYTLQGLKELQTIHFFGTDISEQHAIESQLRDAIAEAQIAVKAKSEFLATMSHEIRTPMNGILGMTELLLDSGLNEEQAENARVILISGEALLSIINDILDFSKIEAGKLKLEHIEFDIRACIEEVAELFAPRIQGKGLEFPVYIEPDLPTQAMGDPVRFKQVITNLISNAVKFTQKGEIRIHCSLVEIDDSFLTIRVDVFDTGIGIPKDKQELLFESFTQADTSTTRQYGGTGLGLSISQQLAKAMGGLIAIHSIPDEGSLFAFGARFARPEETDDEQLLFEQHRNCRVLLCMSNESNQRGIRSLFANWRCETLAVTDADQALELIRYGRDAEQPFHLLLLDFDTVRTDIREFLTTVRSETKRQQLAILLMSGVHDRKKTKDADLDVNGFLTKPVKQKQLARVTRQVLNIDSNDTPGKTPASASTSREAFTTKSILIVEDNPVNQKLAARMLEKAGHLIHIADNGKIALHILEESKFDLILMDCQMPVMDGYEAASEIRRGTTAQDIPIIGLTANALQGDREKCLNAGMNDYLQKPYKPAELLEKVQQWTSLGVKQ